MLPPITTARCVTRSSRCAGGDESSRPSPELEDLQRLRSPPQARRADGYERDRVAGCLAARVHHRSGTCVCTASVLPRSCARPAGRKRRVAPRSEEHTSELQSHVNLVCRLLLEKKKKNIIKNIIYKKKKTK